MLAQTGYHNLLTLSDSRRAIAVIEEWDPDLVLLDLHLPNSDGIALLDNIRHELNLPELPIVVITADASTKARMAALEAGATDFLLKPIDTFEVTLRVRNLLRSPQASPRADRTDDTARAPGGGENGRTGRIAT